VAQIKMLNCFIGCIEEMVEKNLAGSDWFNAELP
jgi:hypothetical protein